MKSFDTNVAVRLIVEDEPKQCERAARAFRQGGVAAGGQIAAKRSAVALRAESFGSGVVRE